MARLVVVGGVAAGASAAAKARRTDEDIEIVLVEAGEYMSFANCGLPYYVGGEIAKRSALFVANPRDFLRRFAVDVRLRTTVTGIDRHRREVTVVGPAGPEVLAYDRLVLATGTVPFVPPVPGLAEALGRAPADDPVAAPDGTRPDGWLAGRVFLCRTVPDVDAVTARLDGLAQVEADGARNAGAEVGSGDIRDTGARVLVIGGGYIGLEVAEQLLHRGVGVTVVEAMDQLMGPLDGEMTLPIENALRDAGARVLVGDPVARLEPYGERILAVMASGATCRVDLVVVGAGVRPNVALARAAGLELGPTGAIAVDAHRRTSDPNVFAAGDNSEAVFLPTGDAVNLPLAGPANKMGRVAGQNAALDLAGAAADDPRRLRMPGVLGTGIVRVCGVAAGGTGLTEKWARRIGRSVTTSQTVTGHHAGYYPGAAQLAIKLVWDPGSGRLLGAQAVGREGVDKRLDVFATAITAGMTVADLEDLDLAYAPPFGSAKDPVIMNGFVAANTWRGLSPSVTPVDFAAELSAAAAAGVDPPIVVDVRTPREFDNGRIPGSVNIPLEELRTRCEEIPRELPVVLTCQSGYRSYVAQQVLRNRGWDNLRNLYGGFGLARRTPGVPVDVG